MTTIEKIEKVRALVNSGKVGTVKDACKKAGISAVTYYAHAKKAPAPRGTNGNGHGERPLTIQVEVDGESVRVSGSRAAVVKILNKIS